MSSFNSQCSTINTIQYSFKKKDIYQQRPRTEEFQVVTYPEYFASNVIQYGNNHHHATGFTDTAGRSWRRRRNPVICRTRYLIPTHGEPYYYQRIVMNLPSYNFEQDIDLEQFGTYKGIKPFSCPCLPTSFTFF